MENIMREPIIGDLENSFDNTVTKNIEILDEAGEVEGTVLATEWFAEVSYPGSWRVSAAWEEKNAQVAVSTLQAAKAEANEAINQWRLKANQTSFPFNGKEIACDVLSRSDLDGMANYVNLFAEFPVGFANGWKCLDNTYIAFDDVQDFKDMYAAMVDTGNANFNRAQQLKQQLQQATTLKAVNSILGELDD
jgi:hypothetical protein